MFQFEQGLDFPRLNPAKIYIWQKIVTGFNFLSQCSAQNNDFSATQNMQTYIFKMAGYPKIPAAFSTDSVGQ